MKYQRLFRAMCMKVPSEQVRPSELRVPRGKGLLEIEVVREGFLEEVEDLDSEEMGTTGGGNKGSILLVHA